MLVAIAMGMETGVVLVGVMSAVGAVVVGSSMSTIICVVSSIGVVIIILALIE